MDGQSLITFNPDTFNDEVQWPYRQLQILCCQLNIGGKGNRQELLDRLFNWHRLRSEENQENIDMNVVGNNFAIMGLNVQEKVQSAKKPNKRNSILGNSTVNSKCLSVSPSLLRPLKQETCTPTPTKSILKKRQTSVEDFALLASTDELVRT